MDLKIILKAKGRPLVIRQEIYFANFKTKNKQSRNLRF